MTVNLEKTGNHIAALRKGKGLTQTELGERLGVSFQAVSKWERGETLPDTALLPDLAAILETTVDNLLAGGEPITAFRRRVTVAEVTEALESLCHLGDLLGRDNLFYIGAMEGIDRKMNVEFARYMEDPYTKEAMVTEALLQCLQNGAYVDVSDIKRHIENPHWQDILLSYAKNTV